MKRVIAAVVVLASVIALARADEGAYRSLVGMAAAAATDKGPDPEAVPQPAPVPAQPQLREALKDAVADRPATRPTAPRSRADAPRTEAAPQASAPARPWIRYFSALTPSRKAVSRASFEAPASTAAASALRPLPALTPPPESEAVKAGERRGMAELMSSALAPSDGQ